MWAFRNAFLNKICSIRSMCILAVKAPVEPVTLNQYALDSELDEPTINYHIKIRPYKSQSEGFATKSL